MRIRNVQRYGARLRRQLDAINLAREQAKALAAAGKGAGDSADSLTAITVQLVQQQLLSFCCKPPHPNRPARATPPMAMPRPSTSAIYSASRVLSPPPLFDTGEGKGGGAGISATARQAAAD